MKIYLDDVREAPEGWVRTYTVAQTIALLSVFLGDKTNTDRITHLSLDHDLGDDLNIGTGYDVLLWIEEAIGATPRRINYLPDIISVHSANPVGRNRMVKAIESIRERWERVNDDNIG